MGIYKNKIKVIGIDLICFPANPETLEPIHCGCYDPWAWSDPDSEPIETISVAEWSRRRYKKRQEQYSWIWEDELPEMTCEEYNEWVKKAKFMLGMRKGPDPVRTG